MGGRADRPATGRNQQSISTSARKLTCCWGTKPCCRVHPRVDGEALSPACGRRIVEPLPDQARRLAGYPTGTMATEDARGSACSIVRLCPDLPWVGERLGHKYQGKSRDLMKIDYSNRAACLACALRPRCTNNFRRVSRLENEAVLDRMAARLKARPGVLDPLDHQDQPGGRAGRAAPRRAGGRCGSRRDPPAGC